MKINIEKLMPAINKFAEEHSTYNLPKFDISVKIYRDLTYQIDLEFIKFPCEITKGNFMMIKSVSIVPDNSIEVENWIWLLFEEKYQIKDYDYSSIIRQPFVKWILQNIELFVKGNT